MSTEKTNTVFDNLMNEVLDNIGLSGLESTESGVYLISVDDTVTVNIACPDDECVFLFSYVGELDEESASEKMKEMLRFNALTTKWAPVMHLSDDNEIVIWGKELLKDLEKTSFIAIFQSFIDFALEASEWSAKPVSGESSAQQVEETEDPMWMSQNFIRA